MAIRFYDEALTNKISKWIKDPNLRILKPDETSRLFQILANDKNDKPLTLPIVAISRDKDITIVNTKKQPKTFEGFLLHMDKKVNVPVNVIPIKLSYQIDIYTRTMSEADEYIRNFVFNFINYPKLQVDIPYNNYNLKHNTYIELDDTISDNSDIQEKLFADEFYRFSIQLSLEDAYLFSVPINDTANIGEIDTVVMNGNVEEEKSKV